MSGLVCKVYFKLQKLNKIQTLHLSKREPATVVLITKCHKYVRELSFGTSKGQGATLNLTTLKWKRLSNLFVQYRLIKNQKLRLKEILVEHFPDILFSNKRPLKIVSPKALADWKEFLLLLQIMNVRSTMYKEWILLLDLCWFTVLRQWHFGCLLPWLRIVVSETFSLQNYPVFISIAKLLSDFSQYICPLCMIISWTIILKPRCMLLNGFSVYSVVWFLLSRWENFLLNFSKLGGYSSISSCWRF